MPSYEEFVLYLDSDQIQESVAGSFSSADPPPRQMTVRVRLPTLNVPRAHTSSKMQVYLSTLFMDCVWRDSNDPSQTLTANSGTSVSSRFFVTFYAGSDTNTRLLLTTDKNPSGTEYDYIVERRQNNIAELSNFMYYNSRSAFDSALWFENQYTNHTEDYGDKHPVLLGTLNPAALNKLQRENLVTITFVNNRADDFTSPYWYSRFLRGVSMYLPPQGMYDIVEPDYVYREYYRAIDKVDVQTVGGLFYPPTFHTLASPFHPDLYKGSATITSVSAPPRACVPLHHTTSLFLGQVAFSGDNASVLSRVSVIEGNVAAQNDSASYRVMSVNPSTASWESVAQTSSTLRDWPNGAWRGARLPPAATALPGYESPFVWEQHLPGAAVRLLNGLAVDDTASMANKVLPVNDYLFMPSGEWDGPAGARVGERSLQFDFGARRFVNKIQIAFPKSEERWQPTRINATLNRSWPSRVASSTEDIFPAYWHGGYQAQFPFGAENSSNIRYIHTLTQALNVRGHSGSMLLGEHAHNLSTTYTINGSTFTVPVSLHRYPIISTPPVYADAATGLVGTSDTFLTPPNAVNPAYDFERYEFGPFLQQPSVAWLNDMENPSTSAIVARSFPVAIARSTWEANWEQNERPMRFWFDDLSTWQRTSAAEAVLGGLLNRMSETSFDFLPAIPPFRPPPGDFGLRCSFWDDHNLPNLFDSNVDTLYPVFSQGIGASTTIDENNLFGDYRMYGSWVEIECPSQVQADLLYVYPWRDLSAIVLPTSVQTSLVNTTTETDGNVTTIRSTSDILARCIYDARLKEIVFTSHETFVPPDPPSGPVDANYIPRTSCSTPWPATLDGLTDLSTAVSGHAEYIYIQLESPVILQGFMTRVSNTSQAPVDLRIFGRRGHDGGWTHLYGIDRVWNTYHYHDVHHSFGLDEVSENRYRIRPPPPLTALVIAVSQTPVQFEVLAPGNVFTLHDSEMGKDITVRIPEKRYAYMRDIVLELQTAINRELEQTPYSYSMALDQATNQFVLTNTGPLVAQDGSITQGAHSFHLVQTALAHLLRFTQYGPTAATTQFGVPVVAPDAPGRRVSFTLTFYETSRLNPLSVMVAGSQDGAMWKRLFSDTFDPWVSTAPFVISNFHNPEKVKYKYYRSIFFGYDLNCPRRFSAYRIGALAPVWSRTLELLYSDGTVTTVTVPLIEPEIVRNTLAAALPAMQIELLGFDNKVSISLDGDYFAIKGGTLIDVDGFYVIPVATGVDWQPRVDIPQRVTFPIESYRPDYDVLFASIGIDRTQLESGSDAAVSMVGVDYYGKCTLTGTLAADGSVSLTRASDESWSHYLKPWYYAGTWTFSGGVLDITGDVTTDHPMYTGTFAFTFNAIITPASATVYRLELRQTLTVMDSATMTEITTLDTESVHASNMAAAVMNSLPSDFEGSIDDNFDITMKRPTPFYLLRSGVLANGTFRCDSNMERRLASFTCTVNGSDFPMTFTKFDVEYTSPYVTYNVWDTITGKGTDSIGPFEITQGWFLYQSITFVISRFDGSVMKFVADGPNPLVGATQVSPSIRKEGRMVFHGSVEAYDYEGLSSGYVGSFTMVIENRTRDATELVLHRQRSVFTGVTDNTLIQWLDLTTLTVVQVHVPPGDYPSASLLADAINQNAPPGVHVTAFQKTNLYPEPANSLRFEYHHPFNVLPTPLSEAIGLVGSTGDSPSTLYALTTSTLYEIALDTPAHNVAMLSGMSFYGKDYENHGYNSAVTIEYQTVAERQARYPTFFDWFLHKYQLYLVYQGEPLRDYLVREDYYFAPSIDQNDEESYFEAANTGEEDATFDTFRPKHLDVPQKMVQGLFAEGRYASAAVSYQSKNRGSTLAFSSTRDTTTDTHHRCFSWRMCHQLVDFTVTGGTVSNRVLTSDIEADRVATFSKRFEHGVLTSTAVTDPGLHYTSVTPTVVSLGDQDSCQRLLRDDTLLGEAISLLNEEDDRSVVSSPGGFTRHPAPFGQFAAQPVLAVSTVPSTDVSFETVGSAKNILSRKAMFKLIVRGEDGGDASTTDALRRTQQQRRRGRLAEEEDGFFV